MAQTGYIASCGPWLAQEQYQTRFRCTTRAARGRHLTIQEGGSAARSSAQPASNRKLEQPPVQNPCPLARSGICPFPFQPCINDLVWAAAEPGKTFGVVAAFQYRHQPAAASAIGDIHKLSRSPGEVRLRELKVSQRIAPMSVEPG